MNNNKLKLLGLAQTASKLVSGTETVMKTIQQGTAILVVFASDVSEQTKKSIENKCAFYEVECIQMFTTEEISSALGKKRSMIAFLDQGFVKSFKK
ncbi:L7Ae/L30e/S12e/Gadd45 family ribosomal protein [Aerococcus urinaeequi]|uniref:Ribosomal protein eL8/eL30/eS12/Gadd45 domain-containing protein n=1 Tax=Aerococcus viridans TaxID=1377 RepID=A0A2N6UF73_9LACT|nr:MULTISPECIES: ribosomal L7Ae/L30e/S12e/Gadd45 family protein [Aerococcus]OFU48459.1 hypothetical protein HMPREF3116_07870 [Aerococcus sp. HMSC10H05]PMC80185.1 hypothetical protein CJ191_02245 [Aerococcus viridans]